jgi:hypothetical protein
MAEEPLPLPETDSTEVDFTKSEIAQLDAAHYRVSGINPARWDRANDEINFQDLVEEFTGKYSNDKISCPFHGTDSTPSFGFWPHKNNGFCFGCPPGQQYYDNILFVAKTLSISRLKAMLWLEKKYKLPPMDDIAIEDDVEEEEEVSVEVADLSEAFIRQAAREVQLYQDPELAEGFIKIYFEAEHDKDPVGLARVLDPSTLQNIKQRKMHECRN